MAVALCLELKQYARLAYSTYRKPLHTTLLSPFDQPASSDIDSHDILEHREVTPRHHKPKIAHVNLARLAELPTADRQKKGNCKVRVHQFGRIPGNSQGYDTTDSGREEDTGQR
jgi:hypothetical protein